VGLFTGCVSRITEQPALQSAITILNHLGVEVVVPADQGCCGAMHQSIGDETTADSMAQHNHQLFAASGVDTVVTVASGCGAQLAESSAELTVADISSYLLELPGIDTMELQPLNRRVAIHTPCSLKNVLKSAAGPLHLLRNIPQIELFPLPDNGLCCGGAGHYLLTQPETADALRRDKLDALQKSRTEILVTSNSGCALHLAAGIRDAGLNIEVLHPVELLARQLNPAPAQSRD
jgi:glycolate oxidase iron-sulfur subunit